MGKSPWQILLQTRAHLAKEKAKKGKKNEAKGDGDYFGYDSLEEYYEAIYGEGWQDVDPEILEEDDPTSPFYVKEY